MAASMQATAALESAAEFLTVQPAEYSAEEHAVWATLYRRRVETLRSTACREVLQGIEAIGLSPDRVPLLADVNARLARLTGWAALPVTGFLPAPLFFAFLAERRFPVTVNVRKMHELDYTPAPDIFHDVFGHMPLHAHPGFADFLQQFGAVASGAHDERQGEAMRRLFWFTIEFGLVLEDGEPRIYGSGLVSSAGDAANALGSGCRRLPFDLRQVVNQPFDIDRLQETLFVLNSFADLYGVPEAARALGARD